MGQCTMVESWVCGFVLVKFDTERELVRKAVLGMRRCPDEATAVLTNDDGHQFHWCAHHAAEPICGARKPAPEASRYCYLRPGETISAWHARVAAEWPVRRDDIYPNVRTCIHQSGAVCGGTIHPTRGGGVHGRDCPLRDLDEARDMSARREAERGSGG